MNVDFMPELKWKLGYPAVMITMAVVALFIYIWFKRKGGRKYLIEYTFR